MTRMTILSGSIRPIIYKSGAQMSCISATGILFCHHHVSHTFKRKVREVFFFNFVFLVPSYLIAIY